MTKPEFIRECLSVEYARLDIRLGKSQGQPWVKPEKELQGWIDSDTGEITPFGTT